MKFRLSKHAEEELFRRQIPRALMDEVLLNPQQIVDERPTRKVYQSRLGFTAGRIFLLRVIVDVAVNPAVVVTVYRTSKITKYWKQP